jgi:LacI family transcriptional regulator
MASLTDIARAARVSTATVSRVVNAPEVVAAATRGRVQRAMARLRYQPNRVARRLRQRRGRRQLLGLIIPEIENPHFAEIVRGVEDAAYARRFAVMLCNSDNDPAKQQFYLDILRAESVDGVIVPPIQDRDPALLAAAAAGLPLVVIDRRLNHPRVDSVLVDNRRGVRLAVEHLCRRGYSSLAHLAGPPENFTSRERQEAWAEALAACGIPAPAPYVCPGDNQRESGVAGAEALLSLPHPPRAIFVNNNLMAIGALEVIHRRGLSVPRDVALVAFDDPPWAQALRPALTTVRQPTREIGRAAVDLLLSRLDQPALPARRVLLPPELMVRDSS